MSMFRSHVGLLRQKPGLPGLWLPQIPSPHQLIGSLPEKQIRSKVFRDLELFSAKCYSVSKSQETPLGLGEGWPLL